MINCNQGLCSLNVWQQPCDIDPVGGPNRGEQTQANGEPFTPLILQ